MDDSDQRLQPGTLHPAFTESYWTRDVVTHETETLTRALQVLLSADYTDVVTAFTAAGSGESSLLNHRRHPASTSDAETTPKRTRSSVLSPPAGKVWKRKTRTSKRSTATFINADPANFRQMVQQMTGFPSGRTHAATKVVLGPERGRGGRGAVTEGGCLPTLDTSTFPVAQAWSSAAPNPGSQGSFGSGP